MNYYKHHLGDYSKDTVGLTMLEHGAYRLLLDAYYATESPIAIDEAYAIAKAGSPEEKAAVDKVLRKFFTREGESWGQKRVEQELHQYRERVQMNREVGRLGGMPRKQEPETQTKPKRFPNGNPKETLTSNQEPITKKKTKPKTPLPDGFGVSDAIRDWAKANGYGRLDEHLAYFTDYALANSKTYADWDAAFRNAVKGNWARLSGNPKGATLPSYS
jgi:uncharacterized protein YdaU (DUF1376 family)